MRYLKKTILAGVFIAGMLAIGQSYGQGKNTYLYSEAAAGEVTLLKGVAYVEWNVGEAIIAIDSSAGVYLNMGFEQGMGDTLAIKKDEMYLYPNPAYTNTVKVKYVLGDTSNAGVTSIDVRVISLAGHMMYTATVPVDPSTVIFEYEFDVSKFNPGVYVTTLFMDTGVKASRKFVRIRL
jgi:hypothetical protein